MAKFLFSKGNQINKGRIPWNKGTHGIMKPNSGSFGNGQKGHTESHSEESKKKMSEAIKKAWASGKFKNRPSVSRETAEKIKNTLRRGSHVNCKICNKEIYKSPSLIIRSKTRKFFCSKECLSAGVTGENSPAWKGGVTPVNTKLRHQYKTVLWRKKVIERDGFECQCCGDREKLEVHHIFPFHDFPEMRTDLDNGVTLCVSCHAYFDQRRNWYLNGSKK